MEPGNDPRLKRLLHEWQVPNAPDALEQRVFGQPRPWWRILMSSRVRIPLPVAIAFSVALVWLAVVVVRDRGPALEPPAPPTTCEVSNRSIPLACESKGAAMP